MHPHLKDFVNRLSLQAGTPHEPTSTELMAVAHTLRELWAVCRADESSCPEACAGQDVLYPVAVSESGGPSLYLVSDGAGVTSMPHEHQTWAVIVGIRGSEVHTLYERVPGKSTCIRKTSEVSVGAGEVFCMHASELHSTRVGGCQSTYHLHLYGKPLSALPSFESRCHLG